MPLPHHKTTDIYLASFLFHQGASLVSVERLRPKKVEFRFVADWRLHQLRRLYWSGEATELSPAQLLKTLHHLRCLAINRGRRTPAREHLSDLR